MTSNRKHNDKRKINDCNKNAQHETESIMQGTAQKNALKHQPSRNIKKNTCKKKSEKTCRIKVVLGGFGFLKIDL
jgi:hypothetical protein